MKLRLPHSLFLFLLSLTVTLPSAADVVGAGVFYDVGKLYYSADPVAQAKGKVDSVYCWAGAAGNATQYWQDFYYDCRDKDKNVPNGYYVGEDTYSNPTGTAYTQVYRKILDLGKNDDTGDPEEFYEWWFRGGAIYGTDTKGNKVTVLDTKDGYYNTLFDEKDLTTTLKGDWNASPALKDLTAYIVKAFETQGQSVTLSIAGTAYHAISCWGYELNEQTGMLSALLLSDTDDARFSVFRVNVEERGCYSDLSAMGYEGYVSVGYNVTLTTDERAGYYGHDWTWIEKACALQTPEGTKMDEGAPTMKNSLTPGERVEKNTSLSDSTEVKGAGITVGNGSEVIVVTTTGSGSLSMNGLKEDNATKSEDVGLSIADGGTVSLKGISLTNYAGGGADVVGRLYLHGGEVTVSDNSKKNDGNGGGIANSSYVEIRSGVNVTFADNHASGKGGAISNVNAQGAPAYDPVHYWVRGEAEESAHLGDAPNYTTVSLRGNNQVTFSGNMADGGGNDIYNSAGAIVNIADNGNVIFKGENRSVAVVNEGYLFLSAQANKSIDFAGSSLDTHGGETVIGLDVNGLSTDVSGHVNFYETKEKTGKQLSLSSQGTVGGFSSSGEGLLTRQYTVPSLLKNLVVNVDELTGVSAEKSSVTNTKMVTTGPLAISHLTMDTTDVVVSSGSGYVTLSDVVINVAAEDVVDGVVDLSGMFTGNYRLENVVFNLGDIISDVDDLYELKFNVSAAYAEEEPFVNQVTLTANGVQTPVTLAFDHVVFADAPVPEPATSALSLLALAGLAARRRRR